jgi:hypothetical protein
MPFTIEKIIHDKTTRGGREPGTILYIAEIEKFS